MTSAELLVQIPTAFAASALFAARRVPGGRLGERRGLPGRGRARAPVPGGPAAAEDGESLAGTLRGGRGEALHRPELRLLVLAVALIGGLDAVEEYFPVLAGDWGVPTPAVPVAVLAIALAGAAGRRWAAGPARLPVACAAVLLVVAGLLLAAAGALGAAAALVVVAVFYALYLAVLVVAEARLQDRIAEPPPGHDHLGGRPGHRAGVAAGLRRLGAGRSAAVAVLVRGRRPGGPGRAAGSSRSRRAPAAGRPTGSRPRPRGSRG